MTKQEVGAINIGMNEEERKVFQKIGSIGGNKTLAKYGRDHFVKAAKSRWEKAKEKEASNEEESK